MQLVAPETAGGCTGSEALQSNDAGLGPLKPVLQEPAGSVPWPPESSSKPKDDICVKALPVVQRSRRFLKRAACRHAETRRNPRI